VKVALADLAGQYRALQPELDAAIRQVMESGGFILGPVVQQFEEEIAACCGARYGVGVNSGTDALLLSLVALGIGPGDEVITTPFTFVATIEAIVLAGARPVFADIDPKTFNLCPNRVAEKLTPRTKAIMPVDLFGQMCDRSAFTAIAQQHGLQIVWDGAQAVGASFDGRPLGDFPGCTTLSFFPTKNLGGAGDGGMVLTNDPDVRDRLRLYRFHGSGGNYYYERVGYCSRLDALQAAILGVKLKHLYDWNTARRTNADRYRELLTGCSVTLPAVDPRSHHIYHQFTIRHPQRDALKKHLAEAEIDSGIYYPLSLHQHKAYENLGYRTGDFPESEAAAAEVLSLPIHPGLGDEQLCHVAAAVRGFSGCYASPRTSA
jgi:dTDP-4-amino-4,6-dideoxygalactose transaminase